MTFRFLLYVILLVAAPAFAGGDVYWIVVEQDANTNPPRVLREAEQALEVAQRQNNKITQLQALRKLTLALGAMLKTTHPETQQRVEQGIVLARELDDMDALTYFLTLRLSELMQTNLTEEIFQLGDEIEALATRYGLKRQQAAVTLAKARALRNAARHAEAMEYIVKAQAQYEAIPYPPGVAATLSELAAFYTTAYGGLMDPAKAIRYCRQALALLDPHIHRAQVANLYFFIGDAYGGWNEMTQDKGYIATQKDFLKKALALYTELGSAGAALTRMQLGNAAHSEGKLSEALAHFDAAMPGLLDGSNWKGYAVTTLMKRAKIYADQGNRGKSMASLAQAEKLVLTLNSVVNEMAVREHGHIIHAQFGDYKRAYEEAVKFIDLELRVERTANSKRGDELKVRFDVQLKDAENARLRAQQREAEAHKKEVEANRLALMLALALTVLLAAGIGYFMRKRAATARAESRHNKALAAAEARANQAKSTFLANMSHDLRSPLNAMLGFTRLLVRDASLPGKVKEDLGIVLRSGEYLYTLINQVLDLSKIEAGRITLNEADFDLYDLLDELSDTFALAAQQKGVQLRIGNAPDVPRFVHADGLKLRQVLMNLLSNALKFTKVGSVTLRVSGGIEDGQARLQFEVADTGAGIAPDELKLLGQAFVQAQAGRQASEGTGLGLAISRNFVQLMGGEFAIASEVGQGTTIRFAIPARIVEASTIKSAGDGRRVTGLASGQPPWRILAVDDWDEGRLLLVRLLAPLGIEVKEARNGQEAVEIWEAWQPHLIWMDVRMPVMDGLEATRRIRAAEKEKGKGTGTVIVALTASSFSDERGKILGEGCDEFMHKPFAEGALFELMRRFLGMEFVYEERVQAVTALPSAVALAGLPAELLAALRDALTRLDVAAIGAAIDDIRRHDADAAQALAALADNFEYKRILTLLSEAG